MENRNKRTYHNAFESSVSVLVMELKRARDEVEEWKRACDNMKKYVVKSNQFERNRHHFANQDWGKWTETADMSCKDIKTEFEKMGSSYASEPEGTILRKAFEEIRQTSCPICCESFKQNDVIVNYNCAHTFHIACAVSHMLSLDATEPLTCAMCRRPVK